MLEVIGYFFICVFSLLLPVAGPMIGASVLATKLSLSGTEGFAIFGILTMVQACAIFSMDKGTDKC